MNFVVHALLVYLLCVGVGYALDVGGVYEHAANWKIASIGTLVFVLASGLR